MTVRVQSFTFLQCFECNFLYKKIFRNQECKIISSLVEIASHLNYGTVGWDFEKDGCKGRQRPVRIIVVVSESYQIKRILQGVVTIEIMLAVNPLVYKVSTLTCHPFKMGSTNTTLPISLILSGYMLETWIQRRKKVGKTKKGIIINQISLIWIDRFCRLTFFKRISIPIFLYSIVS